MKILKAALLVFGVLTFSQSYGQQDLEAKQKKQFAKVDKDSDGYVSLEEMKVRFADKKTKDGKPFNIEKMFQKKDVNGDGKLDRKEFFTKGKKKK
ncbi:EF-hand domain-containing protein [Seonamhaeicola maritimus]|uniref:EF-hand domain-containing protein n=1 Tax=Seonamhaeicola maritimus TaxID=2591822 RepID=A0A5C7GME5_9FLAO|nr:EF-hand domain-containing protein [Seonamhaeicola maritimus]TXG39091.1 EF-hand domain-containing protein [Seonamhaeicola maritimus]